MALTLTSVADPALAAFDAVIDVRSPAEFAEDQLPGAISLPVLDDEERARVGTIYKQQSPFLARKVGAALVARNAARHLEGPLAGMGGGWRPLVYCWRGGQRSGSFATILSQVGWRAETLAGGYRAWRTLVVDEVQARPVRSPVVVLDGNTGTAKTEVLGLLAARGHQVIDLEGLARHRGSLFGAMPGGQPGQRAFEGAVAVALSRLDPSRPLVIEAESAKVGDLLVPKQLWAAMRAAPRVAIEAPLDVRAAYLARAYGDVTADAGRLAGVIGQLRPFHAREVIEVWLGMAAAGAFVALARELMEHHYDPRYGRQRDRAEPGRRLAVSAENLSEAALPGLAERVAQAVAGIAGR
ncbi:MAG: tRNA 2-selenouridine(34) synthase MnmH [Paracoccaceae bacterium]